VKYAVNWHLIVYCDAVYWRRSVTAPKLQMQEQSVVNADWYQWCIFWTSESFAIVCVNCFKLNSDLAWKLCILSTFVKFATETKKFIGLIVKFVPLLLIDWNSRVFPAVYYISKLLSCYDTYNAFNTQDTTVCAAIHLCCLKAWFQKVKQLKHVYVCE